MCIFYLKRSFPSELQIFIFLLAERDEEKEKLLHIWYWMFSVVELRRIGCTEIFPSQNQVNMLPVTVLAININQQCYKMKHNRVYPSGLFHGPHGALSFDISTSQGTMMLTSQSPLLYKYIQATQSNTCGLRWKRCGYITLLSSEKYRKHQTSICSLRKLSCSSFFTGLVGSCNSSKKTKIDKEPGSDQVVHISSDFVWGV